MATRLGRWEQFCALGAWIIGGVGRSTQGLSTMNRMPPIPIVVVATLYLAYLSWMLVTDISAPVAGRAFLSAVLFFFVLRGSRTAGNILAALCGISSALLLFSAVAISGANLEVALLFALLGALLLLFSGYLMFSSKVRRFQNAEPRVMDANNALERPRGAAD